MAVLVKYIVVRNGEEKMTFTSKKEADAYDKLLDIADQMQAFMQASGIGLGEEEGERLAFYLAENREEVMALLRGGSPKVVATVEKRPSAARKPAKAKVAAAGEGAAVSG